MPLVHVTVAGKQDPEKKKAFMEFVRNQICANTSTLPKNIYVYIHELEKENMLKTAPTVLIDWTMMPDRTPDKKKIIMGALTDELAALTGENKDEIVIIINDIPLNSAMLGGVTRDDDPTK